jgi:integrase
MGVYKIGQYYHYDFVVSGRRYKATTKETSIIRARAVEVEVRKKLKNPDPIVEDISFKDLSEKYLKLHAAKKRGKAFFEHTTKILDAHFGETMLSAITPEDVERFDTARRSQRRASTANRSLTVLKQMFRCAIRWKHLLANPAADIRLEKEANGRERFLDADEAARLLEACPAWLRLLVLAALQTGARQGELLALEWSDIDLEKGLIYFRQTKNGEPRRIRLSAALAKALKEAPSKFKGGPVFLNAAGETLVRQGIRASFATACKRAKIVGARFHDLRHTSASWMVQRGVPLNTVRDILGHKSIGLTLRYSHLAPDHQIDAMTALAAVLESGPTDFPTGQSAAV